MYEIFAGDFFATKEQNVVLTTLLGSCISVFLRDRVSGVVGLNHFMLPGSIKVEELIFDEDARYGINAMELMINDMMKIGARKNRLQAKVFGGGQALDNTLNNVAKSNITFIDSYLSMEEIPIVAQDVGGNYGRKLFFFPDTYDVYLKRIRYQSTLDNAVKSEKRFLHWMREQRSRESEVTLFGESQGGVVSAKKSN